MENKEMTLQELEKLVGRNRLHKLFLEYYLTLVGKELVDVDFKLSADFNVDDILN